MMGIKARLFVPRTAVSREDLVPHRHFYRHVERSLDLTFVRDLVRSCYAGGGRPSIDPVVFFKLQLVMFFEGMRSERQLMDVAADRLSVRWYLGYDLHETLPDHSSLTKIRDRYGVTIVRRFFTHIVEHCRQAGLVWGQDRSFDATQVEAHADRDAMVPRFYMDAINTHLADLFPANVDTHAADDSPAEVVEPASLPIPVDRPLEVAADLVAATTGRHTWITEDGRPDREKTHGRYQRMADVWVSTTDPDATLMRKKEGGVHLGYHTHYVVDGGKARVILNVLVTPSEVMENQPMQDVLWHVCSRWQLQPAFACGDTTDGTIENSVALEDAGIRAYTPLPDVDQRTPFLASSASRTT